MPARAVNELAVDERIRLAAATAMLEGCTKQHGSAQLFLFSTAPHKFCVLCCDGKAALLHSNQDGTRGGKKFTLAEHLDGCSGTSVLMTVDEAVEMCRQLTAAVSGTAEHEAVFKSYFGSSFCKGHSDDYWAVSLPVTVRMC
ncbi:hypothetical protein Agub_g414 [Astrephomene gubernaculifera]|uniref:Uncharacterized protein n=1 Tax=Astrephomene gubernaculifera TaxID=47775 RepID=A0AAD3DEP8_9CHLO|nr:hypothetical protein Agub_g414 [Astrephomene gubernaculifera]